MPFYYDLNKNCTTSGSGLTEVLHLVAQTAANQDTAAIKAVYATARSTTAGGGSLRVKYNTGTATTGGTSQTPGKRNTNSPAAGLTWITDAGTFTTASATLTTRLAVGFAQTGGMGGWVALESSDAFSMSPNKTNPVDVQFWSLSASASVAFDATAEFSEGA